MKALERRIAEPFELRQTESGAVLQGYAAVFNREAVIGSFFREVILPGAFTEAIKRSDVRALFNHDPNVVLGRTTNQTLKLSEDETGLRYEITLNANDPDAQRVLAKVERGDVSQSSFAFGIESDEDTEWDSSEVKKGKLPLRKIRRVSPLYDVSPVTYPAYEETQVNARAIEEADAAKAQAENLTRLDIAKRRMELADAEC